MLDHTFILALGGQTQEDCGKLEASLVYTVTPDYTGLLRLTLSQKKKTTAKCQEVSSS